ncbi:MAG: LysR family transcriptional regulator [Lautropia sp.]
MDLSDFNLNLLRTFESIHRNRGVSAAAAELGVTQPAVSAALAQLRAHFGDRLFVRSNRGLLPTTRAQQLAPEVVAILARIRLLASPPFFDPANSPMHFRIHINDVGLQVAMPELTALVAQTAPAVSISVEDVPLDEVIPALDAGKLDLAIGYVAHAPNWARQQRLKTTRYVCGVRRGHPLTHGSFTLSRYLAARHVNFIARGSSYGHVDAHLARRGMERTVGATVHRLSALPFLVARTDLVMTVPEDLGLLYRELLALHLLPVPLALPSFPIAQYWHERLHADPIHRWFRARVRQVIASP